MSVPLSVILDRKGTSVATVSPRASVEDATAALAEHNVGALVVSSDGRAVEGILSERDIVRELARRGCDCLHGPVRDVMSTDVHTCGPDATVDDLMATMTQHRIRHVPVLQNGVLAGLVSIGDVVKSRLDELELQAETLEQYVLGTGPLV